MAIEVIRCPVCREEVRVPENLLGTAVRCPRCRSQFRAPVRRPEGGLTEPQVLTEPVESAELAPLPGAPTRLAGLLLLLVGLAGAGADGWLVYRLSGDPEALVADMRAALADPNNPAGKALGGKVKPEDFTVEMVRSSRTAMIVFLGVSVVVTLGALAMLARRLYYFSLLACVLAMLNFGSACCLLGVPVGLWGLIRLLDPRVRASFS